MAKEQDSGGKGCADNHHQNPEHPAGGNFPSAGFGEQPPQSLFQKGDQFPDPHHRVGDAVGIPHQQIDAKTNQKGKQRPFHARSPPECMVKR